MSWYLDTSAFLKLFVRDSESEAMRSWFGSHGSLWSSQVLQTEALRSASRLGLDAHSVEGVLADISLVLPSTATFAAAARLQPVSLRTLDALHLATALELGGDLDGIVAYDGRMLDGAVSLGIEGSHIADPMGVAGEDCCDGRAEVVPNGRGTEGTELADGEAPRAHAIDEAGFDESTEHIGRWLW